MILFIGNVSKSLRPVHIILNIRRSQKTAGIYTFFDPVKPGRQNCCAKPENKNDEEKANPSRSTWRPDRSAHDSMHARSHAMDVHVTFVKEYLKGFVVNVIDQPDAFRERPQKLAPACQELIGALLDQF